MGFLGVWVGSYVAKKIDDLVKFLWKVEQCTTFEGKKIKFNLELEKKRFTDQTILKKIGQFMQL
jgi:hypothetical protein